MQRWALLLAAYSCDIKFRLTVTHNADASSRLPLPVRSRHGLYHMADWVPAIVTSNAIRKAKQWDPSLSKVKEYVPRLEWWPESFPKNLQTYRLTQEELSVEQDCLPWWGRVIILHSLKQTILADLHREHLGISKTKALTRSLVGGTWPWLRSPHEQLSCLCCSKTSTSQNSHASMDMAKSTVAEDIRQLCRPVSKQDVSDSSGHLGRGDRYEPDYSC